MAFGLNLNTGGDFLPIVKFDARAGRLFALIVTAGSRSRSISPTTSRRQLISSTARLGWIWFQAGQAPDFVMGLIGDPLSPQPSKNHRQGVRLRLLLGSKAAGGKERLRELATTAKTALDGLSALHDSWLAGREANPGKVVVVRLAGVRPVVLRSRWAEGDQL